ncbi:MAG: hypothetical protein H0X13_12355 [Ramlibacter sp.]|nr:hypothetical protein [Ramlibacter sp.]
MRTETQQCPAMRGLSTGKSRERFNVELVGTRRTVNCLSDPLVRPVHDQVESGRGLHELNGRSEFANQGSGKRGAPFPIALGHSPQVPDVVTAFHEIAQNQL